MFTFAPKKWVPLTRQRYGQRMVQVNMILEQIMVTKTPTVVLCDCNMTDTSQTYYEMDRLLEDSFREVGWGLGHTSPTGVGWPLQRLDYVWHTPEIRAIAAQVGPSGGSDHFSLVVTLGLAY